MGETPRRVSWAILAIAAIALSTDPAIANEASRAMSAPVSGTGGSDVTLSVAAGSSVTESHSVGTSVVVPTTDVVFLADLTGGTAALATTMVASGGSIMNQIQANQPAGTVEFAAADYLDGDPSFCPTDPYAFRVDQDLTSSATAVETAFNIWTGVANSGYGCDVPESQINALYEIGNGAISFRPGSHRVVVWLGESVGHDPSLGHTLNDAVAALESAGVTVIAVPVDLGAFCCGLDSTGQATAVADATGGQVMGSVSTSGGSGESNEVLAGLQAYLNGLPAQPVTVTPSASCDSGLSVTFDATSKTVTSGSDAGFSETFTVAAAATPGTTLSCSIAFLVDGTSIAGLQQSELIAVAGPADATPPTISVTATSGGSPYEPGSWTKTNVLVHFECTDNSGGSGVKEVTPAQEVSTEGSNLSATGTCTDNAGNSSTTTFSGIQIDKTPPAVALQARTASNGAGWNNTPVSIVWLCTDALSGVVSPEVATIVTTDGAGQSATALCADLAGNTTRALESGINIDTTPPSIALTSRTPANSSGWNNGPVTVQWMCADALSGVVASTDSAIVSSEGTNQTATGACTDKAGNLSQDSQSGINVDTTNPSIQIASPSGGYSLGQAAAANYACTDSLSGIASCVGSVAQGANVDTSSVGSHTFSVVATDNAGNSSTSTVMYTVGYQICSLYDQTATHKQGSTVPIKIEICDATGRNLSQGAIVVSATSLARLSSSTTGTPDASGNANPDNNFRFDSTLGSGGAYIYNLSTKGLASGTYLLGLTVAGDPTTHVVSFQVT